MANLRSARKRLGAFAVFLLVIDVLMVAFLLSPLGRSRGVRQQEYEEARRELQVRMRDNGPLKGMDKKLDQAREQIAAFYDERLPGQYSAISTELGKVAAGNGVRVSQVNYEPKAAELPRLEQVAINANLDGDYLQVVKFINALERDKMFFIVDSLVLAQEQGGMVRLQLKLETYRKTGTA